MITALPSPISRLKIQLVLVHPVPKHSTQVMIFLSYASIMNQNSISVVKKRKLRKEIEKKKRRTYIAHIVMHQARQLLCTFNSPMPKGKKNDDGIPIWPNNETFSRLIFKYRRHSIERACDADSAELN